MYSPFQIALRYAGYYISASNRKGHGIHSPFVFEFVTRVLNDHTAYGDYAVVEQLRASLRHDSTVLQVEDLGAGSSFNRTRERPVASIARHAAKPAKLGKLLYRMVKFYQPATIIDLGTSLGITTSYLAKGNPPGRVFTFEGAPGIIAVARENFSRLGLENVELVAGNFDRTLPFILDKLDRVDFCFVDGNHRLQPTIQYFDLLVPKTHNLSIVVLDDIHWSREMEQAWEYCKAHASVTLSIDLFFIGILVFRREIREKQHFTIRF